MSDKEFEVYDKVWTILDNKVKQIVIYSVIKTASTPAGVHVSYRAVNDLFGANMSNSYVVDPDYIFASKEELLESL
jgi:hypothetical protein